jgi:hypothetical protein
MPPARGKSELGDWSMDELGIFTRFH